MSPRDRRAAARDDCPLRPDGYHWRDRVPSRGEARFGATILLALGAAMLLGTVN